ncbi:MAG: Rieske 2Fe-2S domain-containing protein [Nitrospinae bacterium]|nr:Rieske 2Fe-2S domain-containing protein [Nitrospinota bacterium]
MAGGITEMINQMGDKRRNFLLNLALGFFGLVSAFGAVYPLGMYLWPREEKKEGKGARSMKVPSSEAPIGEAKFFRFLNKPAVIIRPNEQELYALSAICTHLGCVVKWNEASKELQCPCHGGRFDVKGTVLGGPPPKALASYSARLENEYIVIEEA